MSIRSLLLALLLAALPGSPAAGSASLADAPSATTAPIRLWPSGAPPGDNGQRPAADEQERWERPGEVLRGVSDPTAQVFLPEPFNNTGAAVVLCPGGGYQNLWIAKEGWRIADELRRRGVTGIVLKYRHYDRYAAVEDAHRALRLVRSRAREWRLDEHAIGIGGFSAGGHLALHAAAQVGRPETWSKDAIDRLPRRPDFVMAIYPSVSLPKDAVVDASFPPTFLAVAADDTKMAPAMLPFFGTLIGLKVPAELHVYERGGHGFGAGTRECGCASWLDLFRSWLDARGLADGAPDGKP